MNRMGKTVQRSIWINAPRERVWRAVTEPAQIAAWFAPGTTFSFNGNIISIRMGDADVEVAIIEVLDPPRQITTRSLPDRALTTTYTLEEENGGTRFTVTEAGYEALPPDARADRFEQDGVGWELALDNLNAYLDGRPLPRPEGF
jgi:uncharacterized protein YndB with AHSA1/START domain